MLLGLLKELLTKIRRQNHRVADGGHQGAATDPNSLFLRCIQLSDSRQFDLACNCYREVLRLDPLHAKACNNLGILCQRRGEMETAIALFNEAIRIDHSLAEPHVNLGNLYQEKGDLMSAVQHYQCAIRTEPEYAHAHCCLGEALLAMGQHETGWIEYEWRWKAGDPNLRLPPVYQPLWDGTQDIAHKRVLLHTEQGFGDAIQFIRYAPLVAARKASVIVICHEALRALFQTVPGVQSVATPAQPLPDFDYHVPLMSLPRTFKTTLKTIPSQIPYLSAAPSAIEAWRKRLAPYADLLKIGLVWMGSATFIAAKLKSCPVEQLAMLVDAPKCAFFSLQMGEAAAEVKKFNVNGCAVIDHTGALGNFSDTAAFVSALDVVITIDTAVAHLAGALGKRVWVLLAHFPDWRWLPEGGAFKWYPTARLFKQHTEDDWGSVMAEVKRSLLQLAMDRSQS